MSYESPLKMIFNNLENSLKQAGKALDSATWSAVLKCGVSVDKEELIKALKYDRGQYEKGYRDRDERIVRCKDCKNWYFADNRIPCERENVCGRNGIVVTPDWYCADGERRDDDG